jgi:hypothetical protein
MKEVDNIAMEYALNKFLPYLMIFVILFTSYELSNFRPWVVCGLIFFIDKYAFRVGRSLGEYENNANFRNEVDKKLDE